MVERSQPFSRNAFKRFVPITTRWADNDVYGHVNNVAYYAFFDTAVNSMLIEAGLLDVAASPIVGLVAETQCTYFASLAFPEKIEVGVAVTHLGRSSVRYALGVFKTGDNTVSAQGAFTHVYVHRESNRPVEIPPGHRLLMEALRVP